MKLSNANYNQLNKQPQPNNPNNKNNNYCSTDDSLARFDSIVNYSNFESRWKCQI